MTKSIQEFQRAKDLIPGGVDSPVRAFSAVGGNPLFIGEARVDIFLILMEINILIMCRVGVR